MNRIWSAPNVILVRYAIGRRQGGVTADWRWLRRDDEASVSVATRVRLEPKLSWRRELAAGIAAGVRLALPQLVLLMADRNLNYLAGPLHLHEARQLIGDISASSRGSGHRRVASAAVDAVGSTVLVRALTSGFVEAIPYCAIDGLRCRVPSRSRSVEVSFLAPLPDRSLRRDGFDSMALDAARIYTEPPADHWCQGALANLFWTCINPTFGSAFKSAEGCFIAGEDDEAGLRRATTIIRAAFLAFFDDPSGSITIALPTDRFGLPTIKHSCMAADPDAWPRFDAVADLAIAGITAWCKRAADEHATGASPDIAAAISGRTINIDHDPAQASAHDRLEAYQTVAGFWRAARRDPLSKIALRNANPDIIDALDREFSA